VKYLKLDQFAFNNV